MKKKILFIFSVLLLSAGLAFADAGKDYKSGKPWIDSNIKENVVSSQRPSPKDDFHLYVNYDWLMENEIPEGDPRGKRGSVLVIRFRKQLKKTLPRC